MLARIGGDEFAVIVRTVQNKADVQEIAARLEHCFDHPFMIESYLLTGSASVGVAFYPEDGETKDSFLSAADAAMYVAKNTKMATSDLPIEEKIVRTSFGLAVRESSILCRSAIAPTRLAPPLTHVACRRRAAVPVRGLVASVPSPPRRAVHSHVQDLPDAKGVSGHRLDHPSIASRTAGDDLHTWQFDLRDRRRARQAHGPAQNVFEDE